MSNILKVVALISWLFLIVIAVLLDRNTGAVDETNEIGKRQEYQRVLLGCQTAGAIESDDRWLRELCDEELPQIREAMLNGG